MKVHFRSFVIPLLALVPVIISAILGWPGIAYTDNLLQYRDILSGARTSWHPAFTTVIWNFLSLFSPAPANLFVLQLAFLWGAYWSWLSLFKKNIFVIIFSFCLFLTPTLWSSGAVLWKDTLMLAAYLWGFSLLQKEGRIKILGLLFLILGTSFRFNAFTALLPILIFYFKGRTHPLLKGIVLTFFIFFLGSSLNTLSRDQNNYPEQTLMGHDLVGISINGGEVNYPTYFFKRDLFSPEAVKKVYVIDGVNTLYYPRQAPIPFSWVEKDYEELRALWIKAIANNPLAYLKHRLDVFGALLRIRNQIPHYYGFQLISVKNELGWGTLGFPLRNFFRDILVNLKDSYFYTPWMFLLLGIGLLIFELKNFLRWNFSLAGILILSSFSYIVPLIIFAPAYDFRYTLWAYLGIHLALVLKLDELRKKLSKNKK